MIEQQIGSYRVLRQLGEGGIGVVYMAVHEQLGRQVAIKVLRGAVLQQRDMVKRLLNEARATNLIRHPGIVDVTETGQTADGLVYIVMEYLEGESLGARLERLGGRLEREATLRLGQQIAEALAAAHGRGIIHRDLKPDNVMLVRDAAVPGGERTKLLDFGIAKVSEGHGAMSQVQTQTGALLGTPIYMSPEQCRGAKQTDGKTDVYALGVMLYQMLAGQPPFSADGLGELLALHMLAPPPPIQQADPTVPAELARLLNLMLAKAPESRPTMVQVAEALGRLQAPAEAAPPSPPSLPAVPALALPRAPRRWLPLVGAAALLLGLAAVGYALRPRGPAPPPPSSDGEARELLAAAEGDLQARRWTDATDRGERALRLPGLTPATGEAARALKGRAEQERRSQGSYERMAEAAAETRYRDALESYRRLSMESAYWPGAKQLYDRIFPFFVREQLERAERARRGGRCEEMQAEVEKILRYEPSEPRALELKARPCQPAPR